MTFGCQHLYVHFTHPTKTISQSLPSLADHNIFFLSLYILVSSRSLNAMDRTVNHAASGMDLPIMHDSDRYDLVKDIGSGNFGIARLMRDKHTKELVAVKYIERGDKVFFSPFSFLLLTSVLLSLVINLYQIRSLILAMFSMRLVYLTFFLNLFDFFWFFFN